MQFPETLAVPCQWGTERPEPPQLKGQGQILMTTFSSSEEYLGSYSIATSSI